MITELYGLRLFVGSAFASLKATERGEEYDVTVYPEDLTTWQARGEEFAREKLWQVHQRNSRMARAFMSDGGYTGASARVAKLQAVNAIEARE